MVESADTRDLKSLGLNRAGSSPAICTKSQRARSILLAFLEKTFEAFPHFSTLFFSDYIVGNKDMVYNYNVVYLRIFFHLDTKGLKNGQK